MTTPAPHTLYAVKFHRLTAESAAAVTLGQIVDQQINPGLTEIIEAADGLTDATFVGVESARPVVSFTTKDIASALDLCGLDGTAIDSDETHPGIVLFLQAYAQGSTRAGASSHVTVTIANGMIVWRSCQASQGQAATATFDILARSTDGSTAPVVLATSASLAGTIATAERWTLGTVKCNNADLPALDLTISSGITELSESADGLVYPTFIGINDRRPSISFSTRNVTALSTHGIVGAAIASSTVATLREMAQGATRTAVGTTTHISFTVTAGRISVNRVGGAHGTPMVANVTITPRYNGTNALFVIDTTAAIV